MSMSTQKGFSLLEGLLIVLVISIIGFGGYYVWSQNQDKPPRPGLVKVDDYVHNEPGAVVCQALMPECGVCFGDIIDKECWVNPEELSDSDKEIMGI